MPTPLTAAMIFAAERRYNNQMLLDSHNRGTYLTVDVSAKADGSIDISADPAAAVAVRNSSDAHQVSEQIGGRYSTRTDIQSGEASIQTPTSIDPNKKEIPPQRRLLTLGGVVELTDSEGNTATPLHTRNGHAPLAGLLTNASGLASEQPRAALWMRINEEAGYVLADKETKTLKIIVLEPDAETQAVHPTLVNQIIKTKMEKQHNIRGAVAFELQIPEIRDVEEWGIQLVRVDAATAFKGNTENSVSFSGAIQMDTGIQACVHDDPARQTITLTVPMKATIPFAFKDMVFIDPEGFRREYQLVSNDDLAAIGDRGIPSLNDYVARAAQTAAPVAAPVQGLVPVRA